MCADARANLKTPTRTPHILLRETGCRTMDETAPFNLSSGAGQTRIVVIDADESVRRALQRLLRSAGFEAVAYGSARDFFDRQVFDKYLLIMDSQAADVDCFDLLRSLAAKHLPVIFTTAHETPGIRTRAMANGAVAFLQKPFDDRALLEAIGKGISEAAPV